MDKLELFQLLLVTSRVEQLTCDMHTYSVLSRQLYDLMCKKAAVEQLGGDVTVGTLMRKLYTYSALSRQLYARPGVQRGSCGAAGAVPAAAGDVTAATADV
jgi:hypothetical protein